MGETSTTSIQEELVAGSTDYVRFIILAQARTGSTMLVHALRSNPHIRCFGEVLNKAVPFVAFGVDGYDNSSAGDRALRDGDFRAFLRERIYCRHPEEIRAAGFKLLYGQFWDFRGLVEHLVEDTEIRVLYLQRRNILRILLSLKMAQTTGVWVKVGGSRLTLANLRKASRHPQRAAARLPGLLRRAMHRRKAPRVRVTITKDELFKFIIKEKLTADRLDDRFREHPKLTVYYEDVISRRRTTLDQVQAFIGVEARRLDITTRQQNPEPLRQLLANYDELYEAFKDTPHAAFFD